MNKIDLTGATIGGLQILNQSEMRKSNSGKLYEFLLCKCFCGNEVWIRKSKLLEKVVQNCGCTKLKKSNSKDISNQRFGKWLVLNESKKIGHSIYWLCRCECGLVKFVQQYSLIKGRSTGCKKCGLAGINSTEGATKRLVYRTYKRGAEKRGLSFELTFDVLIELVSKRCYYCNRPPLRLEVNKTESFLHHGIDRLDSDKGYTLSNCVPCCKDCNYAKRNLNSNEFLDLVKNIYENCKLDEKRPTSYSERLEYTKKYFPDYFKNYNKQNLDIGCGDRPEHWLRDAVLIDMFDYGQDIVKDITNTPWPISDNCFGGEIRAQHILEHIQEGNHFIGIINEIWRVGKNGAKFTGAFPRFPTSPNWYRDVFHCRMTNEYTFDMFLENTPIHFGSGYDIKAKFRKVGRGIWINENNDVCWELEIIK